MKRKNKNSRDN